MMLLIGFMRGNVSMEQVDEYIAKHGVDSPLAQGATLLHFASQEGMIELVRYLVDTVGATIDVKNGVGSTALDEAAYKGHADIASLLISKGADVDTQTNSGYTPLHRAAFYNHVQVVSLLLLSGASPLLKDNDMKTAYDAAIAQGNADCAELLEDPEGLVMMYGSNNPKHPNYRPAAREAFNSLTELSRLAAQQLAPKEE